MNRHVKQTLVAVSLMALTTGVAAPAWAAAGSWQGHWAEQDRQVLLASTYMRPEALVGETSLPDDALSIRMVADVLTYLYGVGGDQADPFESATFLGLIRASDFDGELPTADQSISREVFALQLARALGLNGVEDPSVGQNLPFADADRIQAPYRAAVHLLQAEGLLGGDGTRFYPADAVTVAQAARILHNVSDWSWQRVARITGLNPAEATYLIAGKELTLTDGVAEEEAAPGSAMKEVTKLTDRLSAGDLNGDGTIDLAAVLTQTGGGSGTFSYLAAVRHDGTPIAAALLGDRVMVQKVQIVNGKIVVDLLTRANDAPMTARPDTKETWTFAVKDGALVKEVSLNAAEATYLIGGQKITLTGGVHEVEAAPGSAMKAVTKLSDWFTVGDLNNDGKLDLAAILTRNGGGSGTFYYLAAVGQDGTPIEAAFLGDRIAIEKVKIVDGKIVVDLLTRASDAPMVSQPDIKETRTFVVNNGALVQVEK